MDISVDTTTLTQDQGSNIEKAELCQQEFQDCEEINNVSDKKDAKPANDELLKTANNCSSGVQSTSGVQKFFYFYQGAYLIIFLFYSYYFLK